MTQAPVIVIGGPTASGKSGLAVRLAERLDGVVINADAIQVYRDLRIVTARPSEAEEEQTPHRLYGVLDAADSCSAGRWRTLACDEIAAAAAAGKRAIVVGGTGLYLRTLIEGIAAIPDVPADVRRQARERASQVGARQFHAELAARDPVMAARLRPGDAQRVIRAWEVLEATGRSLAHWQDAPAAAPDQRFIMIVLTPPREELYAACDRRLEAMVELGALSEVGALMRRAEAEGLDPNLPILKAVGYAELATRVAGRSSLPEALAAAQQATRRFAKRQTTWFRHQLPDRRGPLAHVEVLKYNYINDIEIFSKIS